MQDVNVSAGNNDPVVFLALDFGKGVDICRRVK
jgi:hypothetical protein